MMMMTTTVAFLSSKPSYDRIEVSMKSNQASPLKHTINNVKFGDIAQHMPVSVGPAQPETETYVGLEHRDPLSPKLNLTIPLCVRAPESGNGRAAESRAKYGEGDLKEAIGAWEERSSTPWVSMTSLLESLGTIERG